jgi:hypothetical protein
MLIKEKKMKNVTVVKVVRGAFYEWWYFSDGSVEKYWVG